VDDVVRGTHRSARLLRTDRPVAPVPGDLLEVPSAVLSLRQPATTTASVPRQRGVFDAL
jgi:hypothetical protein